MIHIALNAEEVFRIAGFSVTNTFIVTTFIFVLLAGGTFLLSKRLQLVPSKSQSIAEIFVEGALVTMDPILGSRSKSEKYLPFVATIFLLVLLSNWFGLIPGVGSILTEGGHGSFPLFRAPSSDLNFTLAIALTSVVAINLMGFIAIAFKKHASKFINFKSPIGFFVGILEIISEIAKMVSFSFRLFGNIFAGEVLLVVIAFLVPYIIPLPFLALEVFVGFIQALVFSMLTLVFISIATVEHH